MAYSSINVFPRFPQGNFSSVIWAENPNALSIVNDNEWSFGAGSIGNNSLPCWESMEAIGMIFQTDSAEVAAGATATIGLQVNDVTVNSIDITTSSAVQYFVNPVSLSLGDLIGFKTTAESNTTQPISNVRVGVILRREQIQ